VTAITIKAHRLAKNSDC